MKRIASVMAGGLILAGSVRAGPDAATPTNSPSSKQTLTAEQQGQVEFDRGISLMRDRKYTGAAEAFQRAISGNPNLAEAYNNWGICLVQLGKQSSNQQQELQQFQAASEKFDKAAGLKPSEKITYMLWSETLVLIGDLPVDNHVRLACYQGAVEKCRKAVELDAVDWEPYNKWAAILSTKLVDFAVDDKARLQVSKEAAGLFGKAADRARFSSELGPAYANWASALVRAAKLTTDVEEKRSLLHEALDKFDLSTRAVANSSTTYAMWGSAYLELGKLTRMRSDFREGIDKLTVSISLDPKSPAPLYNLACAYALMDDGVLAVQTLKQCLDLDANNTYRILAPRDPDLASLHSDPGFQDLFGGSSRPAGVVPAYNPPLSDRPR